MSAYSLQAYLLAVKLRSAKTILVEGATDKRVIGRLLLEQQLASNSRTNYVIDEVGIVSSDTLSGKGCKEKVEIVAASLISIKKRVNWLVDREWEGFDLNNLPQKISELPDAAWGHRTKGHSIENYWINEHALSDYLKAFYGAQLPAQYFVELRTRFSSMLRLATAYSFVAQRFGAITKCCGAISASHLSWNGTHYVVSAAFNVVMECRKISSDIATAICDEFQKVTLQELPTSSLQWLCHGHLGEEMIRACSANLAAAHGCELKVVDSIERGFRQEKAAHHADWLAKNQGQGVEPLDRLLAWAL